ncbi:MAG: Rrf2 family transcriptional regulator [Candidatus Omnitrophica bacterium]|nr:Rrf2 family transcriptional regulator [Candidatus Omnitrophota bacterium]
MKFSTRTLYGLRAILVLAGRFGEGSLSASQIARQEGISVAYLEQILNALKRKGQVKSVRGPQGGYVLAKKPSDTTLENLFCALEGKALIEPGKGAPIPKEADEVGIADFIFWRKILAAIQRELSAMTLKELLDEAHKIRKAKAGSSYTFHI